MVLALSMMLGFIGSLGAAYASSCCGGDAVANQRAIEWMSLYGAGAIVAWFLVLFAATRRSAPGV